MSTPAHGTPFDIGPPLLANTPLKARNRSKQTRAKASRARISKLQPKASAVSAPLDLPRKRTFNEVVIRNAELPTKRVKLVHVPEKERSISVAEAIRTILVAPSDPNQGDVVLYITQTNAIQVCRFIRKLVDRRELEGKGLAQAVRSRAFTL